LLLCNEMKVAFLFGLVLILERHARANLLVFLLITVFMQNHGFRHRSKSLEEILRAAKKKESELIGYDEEPIKIEADISVEMMNLQKTGEMDANIFSQNREVSFTGSSDTSIQSTGGGNKVDKTDAIHERKNQPKVIMQNGYLPMGATDKSNKKEYRGIFFLQASEIFFDKI
jgi:endoribonuclease Dicer